MIRTQDISFPMWHKARWGIIACSIRASCFSQISTQFQIFSYDLWPCQVYKHATAKVFQHIAMFYSKHESFSPRMFCSNTYRGCGLLYMRTYCLIFSEVSSADKRQPEQLGGDTEGFRSYRNGHHTDGTTLRRNHSIHQRCDCKLYIKWTCFIVYVKCFKGKIFVVFWKLQKLWCEIFILQNKRLQMQTFTHYVLSFQSFSHIYSIRHVNWLLPWICMLL